MIKSEYKIIGLMSGTSLDGIDLIYAKFRFDKFWHYEIMYSETISYPSFWEATLKKLIIFSSEELYKIDIDYTVYLSEVINQFIEKFNIKEIDAICSHGHTALHDPEHGLTYQIGNRKELVNLVGHNVVCDFRTQDVKLGGQGAPLVPIGDKLLFSEYDYCLNLGGFANISNEFLNKRIAFDICPVNIVLNHYAKHIGLEYDDKGNIAASGKVSNDLLHQLNSLDFYKQTYPKSLGLEWVRDQVFPLIDSSKKDVKDILRTFIEHVAIQIGNAINHQNKVSIIITGGGVYNSFLIARLKEYTEAQIFIPSETLIEYKEALIFGLLGVLKLRNETNCLSSVTGAKNDHSSGKIYRLNSLN